MREKNCNSSQILIAYTKLVCAFVMASQGFIMHKMIKAEEGKRGVPKMPLKLNEHSGKESHFVCAFSHQSWVQRQESSQKRLRSAQQAKLRPLSKQQKRLLWPWPQSEKGPHWPWLLTRTIGTIISVSLSAWNKSYWSFVCLCFRIPLHHPIVIIFALHCSFPLFVLCHQGSTTPSWFEFDLPGLDISTQPYSYCVLSCLSLIPLPADWFACCLLPDPNTHMFQPLITLLLATTDSPKHAFLLSCSVLPLFPTNIPDHFYFSSLIHSFCQLFFT